MFVSGGGTAFYDWVGEVLQVSKDIALVDPPINKHIKEHTGLDLAS